MSDAVLERQLRPYLLPAERLLWTGRPAQGVRFAAWDLFLIPFSVLWASMAFAFNIETWRHHFDWYATLWGLPFLALSLYITVGRFALDFFVRARTVYAVTNRRILILRRPPLGRFRSIEIGYLPLLDYEEHRSGRGTIKFDEEESSPWFPGHAAGWQPSLGSSRKFDRIAEPRRVYDLIVRETERWRREQYGEERAARSFIG